MRHKKALRTLDRLTPDQRKSLETMLRNATEQQFSCADARWWLWLTDEEWSVVFALAMALGAIEDRPDPLNGLMIEIAQGLIDDGMTFHFLGRSSDGELAGRADLAPVPENLWRAWIISQGLVPHVRAHMERALRFATHALSERWQRTLKSGLAKLNHDVVRFVPSAAEIEALEAIRQLAGEIHEHLESNEGQRLVN